ncbi:MAG: hypothetical protein GAK30_02459 [Paracidovorax wautersii]|uniref:DeoR C terminal sensor domain-containing protein n=1 Tax=Paracidovorax wautersii TaxID=1177982 RepID=A0A7V8JQ33_9BURK|nr:MAG: hypothetical protein GAK30_02459 [Paracidovorax wautersii]
MAACAQRCIILADHAKIGQHSRLSYAATSEIATVVTDTRAKALPALAQLRQAGCEIVLA